MTSIKMIFNFLVFVISIPLAFFLVIGGEAWRISKRIKSWMGSWKSLDQPVYERFWAITDELFRKEKR